MKIRYIKHSTLIIESGGKKIITDPWLVGNFRFFPARPRQVKPEELHDLNLILISHGHGDHLHAESLATLPRQAKVIVPRGLKNKLIRLGFLDTVELSPGEEFSLPTLTIAAVPAKHPGPAVGYMIKDGKTVYFAGDTVLFPGMKEIASRFKIDAAFLPIGGVRMFGFKLGMDPADALRAAEILNPKLLIPIHYATGASVPLLFSMKGSPEELLRKAGPGLKEKIRVLAEGETIEI
ncbi:MAG: MBL fold metallo-hydrolase [Proteobacteria bacterium]|nr:MBL fold metallo-hydrolase [Pseudomonadota bacterium]